MRLVTLALLAVLVAGCSDSSSGSKPAVTTSETASANGLGPAAPALPLVVNTTTLHFTDGWTLTSLPPSNESGVAPVETPVASGHEQVPPSVVEPEPAWSYTFAGQGTAGAGEARLWLRVHQDLTNPFAGLPEDASCVWGLRLEFLTADGEPQVSWRTCLPDSRTTIPAGDHELVFTLDGRSSAGIGPGSILNVGINRAPMAAGAAQAASLLSDSSEFDSRITFFELQEPMATPVPNR